MPESNKERARRRAREKVASRPMSKRRQIMMLQKQVDDLPVNIFTGQVMWPAQKEN